MEIEDMIRATHEVGANEALFSHTVVHDYTQDDLMLAVDQYTALLESTVAAERLAAELFGRGNNYRFKDHSLLCWCFAFILGNGSVMFCCQCSVAVDRVTEERRLRDIWNDHAYNEHNKVACNLPQDQGYQGVETRHRRGLSCFCLNITRRLRSQECPLSLRHRHSDTAT